MTKIKIFVYI